MNYADGCLTYTDGKWTYADGLLNKADRRLTYADTIQYNLMIVPRGAFRLAFTVNDELITE